MRMFLEQHRKGIVKNSLLSFIVSGFKPLFFVTMTNTIESSWSPTYRDALERFILFWGEMASRWGINRTMAQIHALLYALEVPVNTDDIMRILQISRGNANMNLRSLINWNLVRKVHQAGSRKDFYTAEKDVWKITTRIIREREKREIQPVMQELISCRSLLSLDDEASPTTEENQFKERIDNLIELMELFERFSEMLFPFIKETNLSDARQLIELAGTMAESGEMPGKGS